MESTGESGIEFADGGRLFVPDEHIREEEVLSGIDLESDLNPLVLVDD